jgi:hypothetical protein
VGVPARQAYSQAGRQCGGLKAARDMLKSVLACLCRAYGMQSVVNVHDLQV